MHHFGARGHRAAGVAILVLSLWCNLAVSAALESLTSTWPDLNLRAALSSGTSPEVDQGSNLQLRIGGDADAAVAIILVSSEGKARVSVPRRDGSVDRLSYGDEMLFPDTLSGQALYADMPVGKSAIVVVASEQPIFDAEPQGAMDRWVAAETIEDRIRSVSSGDSTQRVAVRRLPLYISTPAMKEFVSTEDLVQFFGVATRSADKPSLALKVEFATDSAELNDWSRRQLDSLGKAMLDPKLAADPFMIEGHTDDVGTDEYNLDLSWRRAKSVVSYLQRRGVTTTRLRSNGMGESAPAVKAMTDAARAQNRRVVVRRLDSTPGK